MPYLKNASLSNVKNFESMTKEFLSTQSDTGREEYYGTARGVASSVLDDLKRFLFPEDLDKKERHARYLELKAEFEGGKSDKVKTARGVSSRFEE